MWTKIRQRSWRMGFPSPPALGHVEKRKKYRWKDPWTMAEWGNWVADGIAGRARKMAEKEEQEWVALVDTWNAEVDR
jgi:hypothetical protein